MDTSIKKKYNTLSEKDFKKYLDSIKNNPSCKYYLDNKYFFSIDNEISELLIEMNVKQTIFDELINSFSSFSRNKIKESYLIDEVISTNNIENIKSTKKDVNHIINSTFNNNASLVSITNSYELLGEEQVIECKKNADIKKIYESLMLDAYQSDEDKCDGKYFRKGSVSISNGIKDIYLACSGEDKISELMKDFFKVYNDPNTNVYLKMILSHFILETIHPYYDGNGRLGRFLMSLLLKNTNNSYFMYLIAYSINLNKIKYQKLFKEVRDVHEYGSLNYFVKEFLLILINGIDIKTNELKDLQLKINDIEVPEIFENKCERQIYHLLCEVDYMSEFGITNEEIMDTLGVSRRTLMYTLDKLRKLELIEDTRISKVTYHTLKKKEI